MGSNRRSTDRRKTEAIRTNTSYKATIDNTTLYSPYKVGLISKLMVLGYLPVDGTNTTFINMLTNSTTKIITYQESDI